MKIIINAPMRIHRGTILFTALVSLLRPRLPERRELGDRCWRDSPSPSPDATAPTQSFALNITSVDTTFVTRDHFIAALEMQLSGEPFAEAMGRDLGGYSRDFFCQACSCDPSLYHDPALNMGVAGGPAARDDLPGFSSARRVVRVLEAADEQHRVRVGRRDVARVRTRPQPGGATGADALQGLRDWVQHLAVGSNAVSRFVHAEVTPNNPLGWPGLWPTLQPYASWDPTIHASSASTGCSISSDDDPGASGSLACNDYECDYTTLHLPNRTAQMKMTIDPGSSGWAGWKEALWTLNYLQVMHDSTEAPVTTVPDAQLAMVGTPGNTVVGADDTGAATAPGTYLGSSDIEGFQAGNFLRDPRQPERAVADAAHDDRRHDARRLREPERRSRVQPREPASLVPRIDRRHRERRRERLSRGRRATRSHRPTATCSISRACSARTRASTR